MSSAPTDDMDITEPGPWKFEHRMYIVPIFVAPITLQKSEFPSSQYDNIFHRARSHL